MDHDKCPGHIPDTVSDVEDEKLLEESIQAVMEESDNEQSSEIRSRLDYEDIDGDGRDGNAGLYYEWDA